MAAKEEFIRTLAGTIVGIIETTSDGDQIARDFNTRQILGYYRAKYNTTTDFYGKILARGNILVSLIWNQQK